ncbi:iron dicitrate transport regulator FecR, partial [Caulobacter zeae]
MEATVLTRPEAQPLTAEATRMFLEAGEASAVVARQVAANAAAAEAIGA